MARDINTPTIFQAELSNKTTLVSIRYIMIPRIEGYEAQIKRRMEQRSEPGNPSNAVPEAAHRMRRRYMPEGFHVRASR